LKHASATSQELEALNTRGFFVRESFLDRPKADTLEELCDSAVAYHNGFPAHLRDLYKDISVRNGITFVNEFGDDSDVAGAIKELAMQPRIVELARSIAGPRAAHHCYQVVYKHPHFDRPFPWHQDHSHTPSTPRFYNIWMALSDMTIDNGCLWMMPGVGLDRLLDYEPTPYGYSCWPLTAADQGIPVELTRGSIVVNTSWTLHKSGGNRTEHFRKAMLVAFLDERATARGGPIRMTRYPAVAA
jgi:ectoine hydroxylase-related dioxygenase (phytanoyl-CoA dioxygenase family)